MPQEERLSAVAKRRRLNGNVSNTQDTSLVISSHPGPLSTAKEQKSILEDVVNVPSPTPLPSKSVKAQQDENTFSTLVRREIVQFSGSREIEWLDHEIIKIRLSKGQKCVISGQYRLWIKEGLVNLLGAKLEPSPDVYAVYATELFDVPAVSSASSTAEFEIYSLRADVPIWSGLRSHKWTSQPDIEHFDATFFVHGYSALVGDRLIKQPKEFMIDELDNAFRKVRNLESMKNSQSSTTMVIGGRRSCGADLQFSYIINQLLTDKDQHRKRRYNNGVIVLDLDWDAPTFCPPGIACLVHVTQPLFGPAFVHVASVVPTSTGDKQMRVLRKRHIARQTFDEQDQSLSEFVDDCANFLHDQADPKCALVIKAGSCLDHVLFARVATAVKKLQPDCGLTFGSEHDSHQNQLVDFVNVGLAAGSVINVNMTMSKKHAMNVRHKLLLQSYFHSRGSEDNHPVWSNTPLELDPQKQFWFSCGRTSALAGAPWHQVTRVDLLETADTLDQCIVAIAAVRDDQLQDDTKGTVVERESAESAVQQDVDASNRGVMVETSAESRALCPALPKVVSLAASVNVAAAGRRECLGLGIVAGVDHRQQQICLLTPVGKEVFETLRAQGEGISLIVQRRDAEGRCDTSWVQLELALALDAKPLRGTIAWRPLSINLAETQ